MCGIFGLVAPADTVISTEGITLLLKQLYLFSESRGKESAGIHIYLPASNKAWTLKSAWPASKFIASAAYNSLLKEVWSELSKNKGALAVIAHSRLVTNGSADDDRNNQPVSWQDVSVVHNGIIVNADKLWEKNPDLKRTAEVDTEIVAALMAKECSLGKHPAAATSEFLSQIEGSASIAWVHDNSGFMVLATNTGDLFYSIDSRQKFLTFASERYIISQALTAANRQNSTDIMWLQPENGLYISLENLEVKPFDGSAANSIDLPPPVYGSLTVHENRAFSQNSPTGKTAPIIINKTADESLLRYNAKNLAGLKRCSRCVLPETFPFINFDAQGVCNYCHGYKPKYKDINPENAKREFIASLQKYRGNGKNPDVIVPFSGGRDSCYGLHVIKKEFGLTPITFTYDWGMVTDLARRNIARVCGELGVQNILVSADIRKKRENIRKNIAAWLKKPELGIVPLFMAGDKHFFTVVNQLKAQTGIRLDLWCANPLENTDFKSGFCGIEPDFGKHRLDYLSANRKLKMIGYYAGQFAANPGYLNSSLIDTFSAFISYYISPRRDFYFIFNHMVWNEAEVDETLHSTYNWETSPDSPSTWRIGDGTAPFYNYIYITTRGFSEFDTFRSNQIREGVISREYALERVLKENAPRTQSLRWYLETVGLDFDDTIKRVNSLDVMGLHN
jgi:hypothetical protein